MEVIKDWPPITRVLVLATVSLSILIHLQLIRGYLFTFDPRAILQMPPAIPELWRILSTFCITGAGIHILFDSYFLYTYSSGLELGSTRFSEYGSYFVYIAFVMAVIQLIGGVIFSGPMLLQPLILALTYTWSQENPNANVTIFVLTFPAKYLPYVMLFITAVSGGIQGVYVQLSGLLAAHLFDFLTRIWPTFGGGRNLVPTPQFVKRWFTPANARVQQRSYGTAVHPAGPSTAGGAAAAAREGWSDTRGPGRRLGGD